LLGILFGRNGAAIAANFSGFWTVKDAPAIQPGMLQSLIPAVSAAAGVFGMLVAFGVAQVGSIFSADAWNNITFTAGEVKNPRRDVPLFAGLRHRHCDYALRAGQCGLPS